MLRYCKRSRQVGKNEIEKDALPMKSLDSIEVLRGCPKFGVNDEKRKAISVSFFTDNISKREQPSDEPNSLHLHTNSVVVMPKTKPIRVKKAVRKLGIEILHRD